MGRRRTVLAVLMVLAAVLTGCSSSPGVAKDLNDNPGGKYLGVGLVPPQPRPSFTLTDTSGQTFSFAKETSQHPTFLYFGYTHCPDVCPETMADIGLALKQMPAALRAQTRVVFVTTDIKDDTGPVIAAWLKAFTVAGAAPMIGLYGSQAQIDLAQSQAHVFLASDGGQQHAATVLLYGADDYARVSYLQSDNEADAMAHDLPIVAKK